LQLKTYHMGGDEVGKGSWTASPACQKLIANADTRVAGTADLKPYFVSKLSDITYRRGLALKGWEDGLMYDPKNAFNRQHFSNQQVLANAWDNIWELGVADRAYRLANLGYEVILSPSTHLYFDHPYETHPEERGYYWATRYSDTRKVFGFMPDNLYANADKTLTGEKITNLENLLRRPLPALEKPENIKGMQGQLWGETVRTAAQFEQMIYPRLMALAERAWFKADWEAEQPDELARSTDWGNFSRTLTAKELPKLANTGADFYLPPPGGIVESNTLMANTSLAGLTIEFSLDAGKSWQQYQGAHALKNHGEKDQSIVLRSRLGDKVSRATTVEAVIH
jgi:hexosaminidase